VYPSEVESALGTIPGVRRALVVDLPTDDAVELGAAIVLEPGIALTAEDLGRAARARLSAFKVPTRWEIIVADDVPMSATGKLDKTRLQLMFAAER
jgi:acyl-CoA synthetase (AMP-forming)/AMP-acid ligase II